jgi:hypothetical protein
MTRAPCTKSTWALLWLGLGGCFSVDSGLIPEPDAAMPQDDAAPAQTQPDAQAEPYAGAEPDAEVEVQPPSCSADAMCQDDEYCSRVTQRCAARCAPERGCVVKEFDKDVRDLASFESTVVILTTHTNDSLGNPRQDQQLLLWDGASAPALLTSGVCRALVHVTASQIYCVGDAPASRLLRIPRASPEAVQAFTSNVATFWHTSSHVWWSVRQRQGANMSETTYELWRVGLEPTDVPERVDGASQRGWLTGTEQRAFFVEAKPAPGNYAVRIFVHDLVHGGDTELPGLSYPAVEPNNLSAAADDQALYVTTGYDNVTIARLQVSDGGKRMLSSLPNCNGTFELRDGSVYWQCNQWLSSGGSSRDTFRVGRNSTAAGSEPQAFASLPSEANARGALTVLGSSLVYFFSREGRLFEVSF